MMSNQLLMLSSSMSLLTSPPTAPPSMFAVHKKNAALVLLGTWDIICGHDKRFEQHLGNKKYHQILSKMRLSFYTMESKTAKKKLVRDIDGYIQSYGGRFLRMDDSTAKLRVMTTAESRNKISRSLRENVSSQKKRKVYIAKVAELDVMCGRGGKANHHQGNKLYRMLVNNTKETYKNTEDKDDKTDLSRSIVDQVCAYGGRFIKMDTSSGRHYILAVAEARIKTSQALRENRDSKSSSSDGSDCDESKESTKSDFDLDEEIEAAQTTSLDTASLDCVEALVSLSRSSPSSVSSSMVA